MSEKTVGEILEKYVCNKICKVKFCPRDSGYITEECYIVKSETELNELIEQECKIKHQQEFDYFVSSRGVKTPCDKCQGLGTRAYPNTSGWRGGIGGQMITTDVCDVCWGTGDKNRIGFNLSEINALIESEKIRFAEECVPEYNQTNTCSWNACRRKMLENIRRAKGNKAVD